MMSRRTPRGFMRFFRRTEEVESGSSLKSVVGLKDVRRAFEQQTTSSALSDHNFLIVRFCWLRPSRRSNLSTSSPPSPTTIRK